MDSSQLVIDDQPVIVANGSVRPGVSGEDPRRAIRNMFRRWRLLLLMTVLGAAFGWLTAVMAADSATAPIEIDHYQASHVLVLDNNIPDTRTVLSLRNLNSIAKRVTIGELPVAVSERIELTPTEVATQVRIIIRSDSESIDIKTIGQTPGIAEELADLYAEELFAHLNAEAEQFSEEAVSSAQGRLDEAEANLARVRQDLTSARGAEDQRRVALLEQDEQQFLSARIFANAALLDAKADGVPLVPLETLQIADGTSSIIASSRFDELVDKAAVGQNIEILFGDEAEAGSSGGALAAVSSRLPDGIVPRLVGGLVGGFLLGLVLITFLNRLDNRVRSKRQIEELLDLPVLAEVPALSRKDRRRPILVAREKPRSRFAEQYRGLASTIMYAARTRPNQTSQVVLITSPGPAEGKTTTVANLGPMLAEAGARVLLINADFRRPRLHAHLGTENDPMEVLQTNIDGVDLVSNVVLESDAPPIEVVAAQRRVIEQARDRYDVIVIDTAPLLATNDAVDLLDLVDDVVMVVRAGKTTSQAADRAAESLERRRAHVLGVAMTGVDAKTSEEYYYYGSYYDERAAGPKKETSGRRWIPWKRTRSVGVEDEIDLDATIEIDLEEPSELVGAPVSSASTSPTDSLPAVSTLGIQDFEIGTSIIGAASESIVDLAAVEFESLNDFAASLEASRNAAHGVANEDLDKIQLADDLEIIEDESDEDEQPQRLRRLFGTAPRDEPDVDGKAN